MGASKVIPAEDWPPYRWLWTNVVLARDPETGEPTPYTHGVRRNPKVWLPVFGVAVVYGTWRLGWRFVVGLVVGALAGHFWW